MLTSPLLVPLLLAVAGLAGWGVARLVRRRRGRTVTALVAALAFLAVTAGGVQLWALAALDSSAVARAVVWRDADVDDWRRFPALPVPAGPQTLELRPGSLPDGVLDEVTLPDGGTEDLDALLERTATQAFLVLRGDELVVERYLHGGIGVTAEYTIGHHTSRLTAIDHVLGDGDWALSRLAADVTGHETVDPLGAPYTS